MVKSLPTVDEYIEMRSEPVRVLLHQLRALVGATLPDAQEMMKWGAPVWCKQGGAPMVYIYGGRDHANLGFVRGAEIDDPRMLLQGSGNKGRHIKVWPGKPMPDVEMVALMQRAADLL